MTERKGGLIPAMLVLVTALLVANLWLMWGVDRDIDTLVRQTSIRHTTMITKWHSKRGSHSFTTHIGEVDPGETDSEHSVRHNTWFLAMLRTFPRQE